MELPLKGPHVVRQIATQLLSLNSYKEMYKKNISVLNVLNVFTYDTSIVKFVLVFTLISMSCVAILISEYTC